MSARLELSVRSRHVPRADCWLSAGIEVRRSAIEGRGLFACRDFSAGIVVARLGGRLVSHDELERLIANVERDPALAYVDSIAVDEGTSLLIPPREPSHFGNHSCDPNLWHVGPFAIATRRAVAAGEELTIDYATQTTNPRVRFRCDCGSAGCRGTVTGEDWRSSELHERYGEHWVPAALRKIADSTAHRTLDRSHAREPAIELYPVEELNTTVAAVVAALGRDLCGLVPGVDMEHIGATSLPDGLTKGDVDVNLRVDRESFDHVVATLSARFDIAQPQNWTAAYASFSDHSRDLPVGIQVTVSGSDDDSERACARPAIRANLQPYRCRFVDG